MGLSSSQARLLMLTSRISDIEYQEVMISQRQQQLAMDSEKAAQKYNEAMNNYKLQVKVTDENYAKGYRTEDLTYENMTSMGYLAMSSNNQIYLKKDDDGNWIIPKDLDGNDLISIDESGKATINDKKYEIIDGTKYLEKSEVIQNLILNGQMNIINTKGEKGPLSVDSIMSDTEIESELDTSDDAEAQSEYEYETACISRKQSQLDLELDQLETQHTALLKELESVDKLIDNNVDRTFDIFSDG